MGSIHRLRFGSPGRRAALIGCVVSSLVLTAGIGVWFQVTRDHPQATEKGDGPDFHTALSEVNRSVLASPGGPWILYAVWGIASVLPFSPNSLGWASYNLTVSQCQAQFNGLTLWNGTIPLFDGSFDSGTAPFWQFAFFSNVSQGILISTNVLGNPHTYPAMSMESPCAHATGLWYDPWDWARLMTPFPANSPAMARAAWSAAGESWTAEHAPAYEVYVFGFSYWGSANPEGLIVKFGRCGQLGAAGIQPVLDVMMKSDGSWDSTFDGIQGCGNVATLDPPSYVPYVLKFSNLSVTTAGNTSQAAQSFQVTDGLAYYDMSGLVTWMTTLNLSDAAGQRLATVAPACAHWVSSIVACASVPSGWYAVLVSSNGAWQDSFPSMTGGSAWEIPSVSFASNQYLVIVTPSSWNVTGDVFSIDGTSAQAAVGGSSTV